MYQICRICLQLSSKLLSIELYGLRTAYEQLTGVSVEHDDGLPRELCVECATLLDKYHKFRDKSIKGDQLLRQIYNEFGYNFQLIKDFIESNCNKIIPLLAIHHCYTIDISYQIDDDNDRLQSNDNKQFIQKNDEIKDLRENDVEYDENIKNDETNDLRENDDENIKNDEIKDLRENDDEYDENNKNDDTVHIKMENNDDCNDLTPKEGTFIIDIQTITKPKNKTSKKTKNKVIDKKNSKLVNDVLLKQYFTLTEPSFEEQMKSIEDRKLSDNYLKNKFKCDKCYLGFKREGSYNGHMQKHSQTRGEYSCDICHATFHKPEIVTKHHRATHLYRYDCVKCHVTIANRSAAIFHATWHEGRKYACDQCDAVFDKKSTYLGHVRIKHPSEFACQYCGYSYLGEKGLYAHRNKKHYAETQLPISGPLCNECNIQFYNEDALNVHNGIKHTLNRLIRNENQSRRKKHKVRKASREGKDKSKIQYPVPCEVCGLELNSGAEYHVHFLRSHPDRSRTFYPYLDRYRCICDKCGKVFACKSFLSTHLLTHEDGFPYACPTCGKRFKTPLQLKTHSKIHVAASFPCPVCGLMYNQRGNRDRHVRQVHSDEKKFKCDYCDKCFKSNSDRKLHTRHIHWKEPWPKRTKRSTDAK